MIQPIGDCDGVFLEEKFIVFNRYNSESFDPKTGVWETVTNILWRLAPSLKSCVVVSDQLYTIYERQLMKYDAQINDWISQIILPANMNMWIPCTAEWRGHIFMSNPLRLRGRKRTLQRQVCGLFNPSTQEFIKFYLPLNFAGLGMSAATVEI